MIWALIPGPIKRAVAWLLAGFVAFAGVWGVARRDARRETALAAAERIAASEIKRGKIEDDIDQDTDLVRRARAANIVRHTEH